MIWAAVINVKFRNLFIYFIMSNRRKFLKNSLLGSLGVGLTPILATAETRNPKLRIMFQYMRGFGFGSCIINVKAVFAQMSPSIFFVIEKGNGCKNT